jgi:hypothetical protein
MTQDESFKAWWFNEGSQPPYTHHDCEEHTMRMCEIAWANGAYKEREACANVCDEYDIKYDVNTCDTAKGIALEIRARGEA